MLKSAIFHNQKPLMFVVTAWVLLSVMQSVHFYYYFDQTLWNSIRWSFRDWFVWFVIFSLIYHYVGKQLDITTFSLPLLMIMAIIAVVSGILQVLIIVSVDFIQGSASRPFWQDFAHFYSKRWFQYLFVFSVFWMGMTFFVARDRAANTEDEPTKVKLFDGKSAHWLTIADIDWIEAAGNYVCVHFGDKQLIVRSTIKDLHVTLGEQLFLRVNRSSIVNVHAITSSHRIERGKLELELVTGELVKVGSTYKSDVKATLGI